MAGFNDDRKLADKRAEVLGSSKKTKNFAVMLLALLLTVVGAYLFLGGEPAPVGSNAVASPGQSRAEGLITHDASEFNDRVAHHYEYVTQSGLRVKYFLIQALDGSLHAALDACESCWPAGKGYKQDGDEMVCMNCRMRFKVANVGVVKGGCNPVPLPFVVADGRVRIKTADLEAGKNYFDLKK